MPEDDWLSKRKQRLDPLSADPMTPRALASFLKIRHENKVETGSVPTPTSTATAKGSCEGAISDEGDHRQHRRPTRRDPQRAALGGQESDRPRLRTTGSQLQRRTCRRTNPHGWCTTPDSRRSPIQRGSPEIMGQPTRNRALPAFRGRRQPHPTERTNRRQQALLQSEPRDKFRCNVAKLRHAGPMPAAPARPGESRSGRATDRADNPQDCRMTP